MVRRGACCGRSLASLSDRYSMVARATGPARFQNMLRRVSFSARTGGAGIFIPPCTPAGAAIQADPRPPTRPLLGTRVRARARACALAGAWGGSAARRPWRGARTSRPSSRVLRPCRGRMRPPRSRASHLGMWCVCGRVWPSLKGVPIKDLAVNSIWLNSAAPKVLFVFPHRAQQPSPAPRSCTLEPTIPPTRSLPLLES